MALAAAQKNGSFVFVAGHDHTLQHIEIGAQTVVISGSAAKQGVAALGKNARFVSGEQGFAELLVEDFHIRKYVDKRLNRTPPFAAVSDMHPAKKQHEPSSMVATSE